MKSVLQLILNLIELNIKGQVQWFKDYTWQFSKRKDADIIFQPITLQTDVFLSEFIWRDKE